MSQSKDDVREGAEQPDAVVPHGELAVLEQVGVEVGGAGAVWAVGMVVPNLSISHLAAATPSGELKATPVPSALRKSPPAWASAL